MIKVGIVGVPGYTCAELSRFWVRYPKSKSQRPHCAVIAGILSAINNLVNGSAGQAV
jgi:N-acetyl-gamma-glutamylphosphate reductase